MQFQQKKNFDLKIIMADINNDLFMRWAKTLTLVWNKYATNSFLTPEKTLPRGASFRAKRIALSPAGT